MILLDIKRYIQTHSHVSRRQIQNRFDLSEEAFEGLITPLLEQGFIHQTHAFNPKGGCSKTGCQSGCGDDKEDTEYVWTGRKAPSLNVSIQVET